MDIWYIWYIYIYIYDIYVYGYIWCMERRLQNAFHCMTECRRPGSIAVFRHGIDMSCCVSNRRKTRRPWSTLRSAWAWRGHMEFEIPDIFHDVPNYHQRGAVVPCYLNNFQFFGKSHGSLGIFQLLMEWYAKHWGYSLPFKLIHPWVGKILRCQRIGLTNGTWERPMRDFPCQGISVPTDFGNIP